jgi:hypothetical protein
MNNQEGPEISAADFAALRSQPEALKAITERLRVKEMGPADHIRTKHEVKAWLEAGGSVDEASAIVERAQARRTLHQTQRVTQEMTLRQRTGKRLEP